MHVFLTGFMGSGKTTTGNALATLLDRPFVDLDETIEGRQGASVAEIFRRVGEAGFRRLEAAALRDLEGEPPTVVATGGGVVGDPENRRWMKTHGIVVWLDADFDTILERLGPEETARRPLFQDPSQARELLERRRAEYGDSDLRIEVLSADSAVALAARIARFLEERECAT